MAGTGTSPEIPLYDLRLEPADIAAVMEVLESGWLTLGPRTAEFESAFAQHLGVRHAVAVSSGTAALHLAYLGAGVGAGDEVIVPSLTFAATASAVLQCGGTPAFADLAGRHGPAARAVRRARPRADRRRGARAERRGRGPHARILGRRRRVLVLLEQDPLVRRGRPGRHRRRRDRGARAPPALPWHELGELEPPHRRHGLLRRDRPRLQLPSRRAPLCPAALAPAAARGGDRAPARADARLPRPARRPRARRRALRGRRGRALLVLRDADPGRGRRPPGRRACAAP